MNPDTYPTIIRRALSQISDKPYTFAELLQAYDVVTDELCRETDPRCCRIELLDWLLAIGPQGQEQLLRQFNDEQPGDARDADVLEDRTLLCGWAR